MDMACFSVYPANFHYLRIIDDINNLYQQKGKGWGKIFEKLDFTPGDPLQLRGVNIRRVKIQLPFLFKWAQIFNFSWKIWKNLRKTQKEWSLYDCF